MPFLTYTDIKSSFSETIITGINKLKVIYHRVGLDPSKRILAMPSSNKQINSLSFWGI
jgi:hypothetical protein